MVASDRTHWRVAPWEWRDMPLVWRDRVLVAAEAEGRARTITATPG